LEIKISYEDIVNTLVEKSKLSKEDIEKKIEDKLNQLSGLISKEGAGHIIANELGVKLIEQLDGEMKVKDIKAGMRNISVSGKILAVYDLREFNTNGRAGKVCNCFMGDETGNIRAVGWGSKADEVSKLEKGEIVKLENIYARENQGRVEVHMNDNSVIEKSPEGISIDIDENAIPTPETASRKYIKDLEVSEDIVEILGHIVQVFDIRYFEVCPKCQKRVRYEGNGFNCPEHGEVEPDYGSVLNFIIDDGTENIRLVCFKNQLTQLFNLSNEELSGLREDPAKFLELKDNLLGTLVKIRGRVRENQMFGRKEFMTIFIDTKPNPDEELKNLEKQQK
jgi:ssDNA-binding replication factor A large subunit